MPNEYRKPNGGSWRFLEEWAKLKGAVVDRSKSFYCGDSAGRRGDPSDGDKKYAEGLGLRFATETAFFTEDGGDFGATEEVVRS